MLSTRLVTVSDSEPPAPDAEDTGETPGSGTGILDEIGAIEAAPAVELVELEGQSSVAHPNVAVGRASCARRFLLR